jgi:acetyl esterase/lipase
MRNLFLNLIAALFATAVLGWSPVSAQGDPAFGYELQLDVVYGKGKIKPQGTEVLRDLKIDVYTPTNAGKGPWPAVVYVHGGAFHRGGRRHPPYKLGGAVHSSPEDWARLLAANGYAVFVLEYRLAPQNPVTRFVPGKDRLVTDIRSVILQEMMVGFSRARTSLGLPPLGYDDESLDLIFNAYMAGVEDAALAIDYIVQHAKALNIDPTRIGMGGHSAGAAITASVGLGLSKPLKAIFPLSAPEIFFDKVYIARRDNLPAVLLHFSQYDDEPILFKAPGMIDVLRKAKTDFTLGWIPGFMHFYPHNAPSLADDGTRMSLGDRVLNFLDGHLKR